MKKNIIMMLLLLCSFGVATAQSTLKTAYFMDRMPMRHKLNPALSSEYGYFSIFGVGDISLGANTNLSIDKMLYPLDNGKLGLFAHPSINPGDFLDRLSKNNVLTQDLNLSIFGLGFHAFGGFNTIDISVRETLGANIPRSIFEFVVGAEDGISVYDMSGLSADVCAWGEVGIGHSHRINDHLTIGAKFKYLVGVANADLMIDQMDFIATKDQLALKVHGAGNASVLGMTLAGTLDDLSTDFDLGNGLNSGFGVDLGATYEWNQFNFSLALTDIGFIKWTNNSTVAAGDSVVFEGFKDLDFEDFEGSTEQDLEIFENFGEGLSNPEFTTADSYTSWLNTTLNVGAEYDIFGDDVLSAGILSTTRFATVTTTECMAVATYSPAKWFDIALSGTVSSYGSYWGFAVNLCPRWINLFIGADSMVTRITPQGVPYSSSNLNLKFGLSIPIGGVQKAN